MLILRRKEGQWIEITHRSGDKIRIRVCNIRARYPGQLDMVLDDPDHFFVIQRAERGAKAREGQPAPEAGTDTETHATLPSRIRAGSAGEGPGLDAACDPAIGIPPIPIAGVAGLVAP